MLSYVSQAASASKDPLLSSVFPESELESKKRPPTVSHDSILYIHSHVPEERIVAYQQTLAINQHFCVCTYYFRLELSSS